MILVAGDDRELRRFVRITLEREGYEVFESARNRARPGPRVPEAIVCDGGDAEAEADLGAGGVPVIWLSTGLPGERLGGPNVLIKPFDPGELVQLLANVLHEPVV